MFGSIFRRWLSAFPSTCHGQPQASEEARAIFMTHDDQMPFDHRDLVANPEARCA